MLIVYNDLHRFNKNKQRKHFVCFSMQCLRGSKSLKITQKCWVEVTVKYLHPSTEFRSQRASCDEMKNESSWSLWTGL